MAVTDTLLARSAIHLGGQEFEIGTRSVAASPGEVVLKVLSAGICGTDLAITSTPPEFEAAPRVVLGHEILGRVVSEGPEHGQRVVVIPSLYCGRCAMCVSQLPTQCLNIEFIGIHHDGGFAEYVSVPRDRILTVDSSLDPRSAVLAEPLACVLHGIARLPQLPPNGVCVALGAGPIGALFALVLERASGQRVIVAEPSAARVELLAKRLGRGEVVTPADLEAAVAARSDGLGASVVVDAVGSLLDVAVEVCAPRGTVHAFGLRHSPIEKAFQQKLTAKELTVTSAYGANGQFSEAIGLLAQGVIAAEDLVSSVYPLDEIDAAFKDARSAAGLKVLIEPVE
jgi:threonine dehydrogenase-like Zn-dependent dehydrogenase